MAVLPTDLGMGLGETGIDLGGALEHLDGEAETTLSTEGAIGDMAHVRIWWVARTIRAGAVEMASRQGGLDRWMEVWDKINRLAVQSEALNLDRKQVMLGLFFALQRAARA